MADLRFRFHGPIDRRLWMGLARRYRYRGLSAAGVAVIIVAASYDLSGTWVNPNDKTYRVDVRHFGDLLEASFAGTSARSFTAEYVTSRNIYRGSINLFWTEAETQNRCGHAAGATNETVVEVGRWRESLTVTYRRTRTSDSGSCDTVPAEMDHFTLVRE